LAKVVDHIRANLVQWIALGILVAAMGAASKTAMVSVIWSLGRFVLPFVVIWILYRIVRSRIEAAMKRFQEQVMQNMQNAGSGYAAGHSPRGGGQTVLDLCPKCGVLQSPGHRCK